MRKIATAALGLIFLVASGCTGDGLSPRENSNSSLPAVMYQTPKNKGTKVAAAAPVTTDEKITVTTRPAMVLPIRAGVVQIGEISPPQRMLEAFRSHGDLFAVVNPMPGNFASPNDEPNPTPDQAKSATAANMLEVRRSAAQMGLRYVLVYGGNIDQTQRPLPWEILDYTIVGYFVVPSERIDASGKAVGSLVDVETGESVMTVSVDARGSTVQPSAWSDSVHESVNNGVRDQLIDNMTNQTIDRLSDRRGKMVSMKTTN